MKSPEFRVFKMQDLKSPEIGQWYPPPWTRLVDTGVKKWRLWPMDTASVYRA